MRRKLLKNSIFKKHFLSFMIVFLVPFGILGTRLYVQFEEEFHNSAIYYDSSLHSVAVQQMNRFLFQVDDITNILFENDVRRMIYSTPMDKHEALKNNIQVEEKIQHKINFYNFADEIKNVIIHVNDQIYNIGTYGIDYDYDYDGFIYSKEKIISSTNGFLIGPHLQPYLAFHKSEELVVSYIKPLPHPTRQDDFIMITMSVDDFMYPLNSVSGGKMLFYVMDQNKRIFNINNKDAINYLSHLDIKEEGTAIEKLGDSRYSISNKRLEDLDLYIIGVKQIESTFLESDDAIMLFFPIIVISLVLCLVISILLSYSLIRPISLLRSAMLRVDEGDLDTKVEIVTDDEIGDLSRHFNEMISRINDLISKVLTSKLKEKEARLSALQAQINPHFIYNTLENISSIAYVQEVADISDLSEGLSNMLRYSVKKGAEVTIRDEINQINNYYKIINIRYDGKINLSYDLDEGVLNMQILRLTLQPIVENSIYHGIDKNGSAGSIKISIKDEGSNCKISIWDDGIGMGKNRLSQLKASLDRPEDDSKSSIGLKNVINRLQLYYGTAFSFEIKSMPYEFTEIIFYIPKSV